MRRGGGAPSCPCSRQPRRAGRPPSTTGTTCSTPAGGMTARGTCRSVRAEMKGDESDRGRRGAFRGRSAGWPACRAEFPPLRGCPSKVPAPDSPPLDRQKDGASYPEQTCSARKRREPKAQGVNGNVRTDLRIGVAELDGDVALELVLEPNGQDARNGLDNRRLSVGDVTNRSCESNGGERRARSISEPLRSRTSRRASFAAAHPTSERGGTDRC
jgi:hypothetical protein